MTLTPYLLYKQLFSFFGQQHWWPIDKTYHEQQHSDPRFEIMIGAILTQNTAWTNVEKALTLLKNKNALTIQKINSIDEKLLKTWIQPSGFFNQKAHRLKKFSDHLHTKYHDDLDLFFHQEKEALRTELLALHGIGPETADSILLYAGEFPVFVVDAYTKRICQRIPLPVKNTEYTSIQQYFEQELRQKIDKKKLVNAYQEFHALIVELAKNYCRKKPLCTECPIKQVCNKKII